MNRMIHSISILLTSLSMAGAQENESQKKDLETLSSNANAFVAAYNKGDPEGLARLFLPSGEIVLANGDMVSGKEEITDFYSEVLSGNEKPKAALEAGSVRFITPTLAIEDGTLHVTKPSGEITSHQYSAVQVKQADGTWLTASIRDEIGDKAPAGEKLLPLEWLTGDWILEKNGTRTFLSFDWSDDGPYLDGKALTEQAGEQSSRSSYRIGWNGNRKNYVSWAFDSEGGYTRSEWTTTDTGWLLRTVGVTADGEVNQSTQSLVPDENHQGLTWTTRDQTIGGETQPDTTIRVVKRPPESLPPAAAQEADPAPDPANSEE
jgi:uncharacterized protein (TIGR02246 family)